jgi:hypothetical protein
MSCVNACKSFCVVVRLALVGVVLALSLPLAAQEGDGVSAKRESVTLSGTISCSGRLNHLYRCTRFDTLQSCTNSCVQAGGQYVLVSKDRTFRLLGADGKLRAVAGGKADVTGLAAENAVEVISVVNVH